MRERPPLADLIAVHVAVDGVHATAIPRLSLIRASAPSEKIHALHEPAVCIVAQGRKQVMLADRVYAYGPDQVLVVSVDVPVIGNVTEASPELPYLCLRLDLDPGLLGALIMDAGIDGVDDGLGPSLSLDDVTSELLAAASRLVALLASPSDIPILAPMAEREILYRLLLGSQAPRLLQIANADSKLQQVNRAILWIKNHYQRSFLIEDIAREARMSPSALHEHFKAVTAMSPLQYKKQLRLQEARRLILAQSMDAASAGHNVGYSSPSQFSREYARLFGAPPIRDVSRMRSSPATIHT